MLPLGPPKVKRLLEEINKLLFKHLFATKNGCSSDDLKLFLNKLSMMLSFVPSEYLSVIAVGTLFGLCIPCELESIRHLMQSLKRIFGELFEDLDLGPILARLERVGCRIICDGKIGRVPRKHGGSPIAADDKVSDQCYIARSEYVPGQRETLCDLAEQLGQDSEEDLEFVIRLLLHKIGMATGEDTNLSNRVQKFQWCTATQRVNYSEISTPNARQLEQRAHQLANAHFVFGGERFQLETIVDGRISSALVELRNKLEGDNYELKERTREREWKPFTWSLRAIRRALRVGILTEEESLRRSSLVMLNLQYNHLLIPLHVIKHRCASDSSPHGTHPVSSSCVLVSGVLVNS